MGWPKGKPRGPGYGRKPGSTNKASRPWKELVKSICENPSHQSKLEAACLERPDLMFKAAEFAFGKPAQTVEFKGELKMIQWPDDEDVAEQ